MIDQATRELRMKGRCDEAFQSWISQPLVRMTISIPGVGDNGCPGMSLRGRRARQRQMSNAMFGMPPDRRQQQ